MESEKNNFELKPFSEMEIDELEDNIRVLEDTIANPGKHGIWDESTMAGLKVKLQEANDELGKQSLTSI